MGEEGIKIFLFSHHCIFLEGRLPFGQRPIMEGLRILNNFKINFSQTGGVSCGPESTVQYK